MSREAHDEQIELMLVDEFNNRFHLMPRHNGTLERDMAQSSAVFRLRGETGKIRVFLLLLLGNFAHGLGVARKVLFHAEHVQVCPARGRQFHGRIESAEGSVGAVVRDENALKHPAPPFAFAPEWPLRPK